VTEDSFPVGALILAPLVAVSLGVWPFLAPSSWLKEGFSSPKSSETFSRDVPIVTNCAEIPRDQDPAAVENLDRYFCSRSLISLGMLATDVGTLSLPVGATTGLLSSLLVVVCWLAKSETLSLRAISVVEVIGSSSEVGGPEPRLGCSGDNALLSRVLRALLSGLG
jgi:hypothetical protein